MKSIRAISALAALTAVLAATSMANAQPAPAAGPAASGPTAGMGPHRGGMGPRSGSNYTAGWGMMSTQERNEHRDKMRSFQTYDECKAYRDQHHEQMLARAKERGVAMPAQPRRDACAGLKK